MFFGSIESNRTALFCGKLQGMGGAKREQELIEWRGYDEVEGFMCLSHIVDLSLKASLSLHSAMETGCRLCQARPDKASSLLIPIQTLLVEVMDAVHPL